MPAHKRGILVTKPCPPRLILVLHSTSTPCGSAAASRSWCSGGFVFRATVCTRAEPSTWVQQLVAEREPSGNTACGGHRSRSRTRPRGLRCGRLGRWPVVISLFDVVEPVFGGR